MLTNTGSTQMGYASLVFAGFVLAYLVVHPSYAPVDVVLGMLAVFLLIGAHFAGGMFSTRTLGVAAVAMAAVLFLRRATSPGGFPEYEDGLAIVVLLVLVGGLFATVPWIVRRPRPWMLLWGLLLIVTMTAMVWPELTQVEEPGIDVFHIHRSGAETLADGLNPYVHATAVDTSPLAEPGDTFEGYTYPPLTLLFYSLGQWLFGDPRFTSLIAILVFVAMVLTIAARDPRPNVRLLLLGFVLVFALHPGWQFVIDHAWTEPLSLPFLLGVALLWRRHPTAAWVLLGLALALKQYFILALPLLLFTEDEEHWRRLAISGSVAALAILPGILPNAMAYIEATIVPALTAPPRPDAANLVQVGVEFPSFVGTAIAVLTGIVLGLRGLNGARFSSALGAVLGVSFFFGFAAFANHWFMVASLALIALIAYAAAPSISDRLPTHEVQEAIR
jgi:hypothetical protein